MTDAWKERRLGDVLTKSTETTPIEADQAYKEVTIRLWGKGVVLRREVLGAEIAAERRNVARSNQFIFSRIDARNGALGVVPNALDGAVVSNDFPAYTVNADELLPEYLEYLARTPEFVALCRRASEGTTNRVRLDEDKFLNMTVRAPTVASQEQIIYRLRELGGRVNELDLECRDVAATAEVLWSSAMQHTLTDGTELPSGAGAALLDAQAERHRGEPPNYNSAHPHTPRVVQEGPHPLPKGWVWTDLGSVLTHLIDCVNDTPDFSPEPTEYVGLKTTNIRPYSLDLSKRWYMSEADFVHWTRRERPRRGDIVLTREAPMGNACILDDDRPLCLTQRLLLLRCDEEFVSSRYLLHVLNSKAFQRQVLESCRGLTTPHIRVGDAPSLLVPIGSRSAQQQVADRMERIRLAIDELHTLAEESGTELEALRTSIVAHLTRPPR